MLRNVCIQSNGMAKRHGRGYVETRELKSAFGSSNVSFCVFSKHSVWNVVQDSVRVLSVSVQQGISHSAGSRAGSGNETRSRYSLEEEGHRGGPSSRQSQGSTAVTSSFWRRMGGLRPILELSLLNRSVMRLKFKMLTIKQVVSQIRSEDWFMTIDLKDSYFHISILPQHWKSLRFAFRGKAYQY